LLSTKIDPASVPIFSGTALKPQATIRKTALGAIAFFAQVDARVDLATLDAVKDNFGALRIVDVTIAPIIVKPEPKEQNEARPQIEQEKYIHVQPNHSLHFKSL
jgi:hypothetical protein